MCPKQSHIMIELDSDLEPEICCLAYLICTKPQILSVLFKPNLELGCVWSRQNDGLLNKIKYLIFLNKNSGDTP